MKINDNIEFRIKQVIEELGCKYVGIQDFGGRYEASVLLNYNTNRTISVPLRGFSAQAVLDKIDINKKEWGEK